MSERGAETMMSKAAAAPGPADPPTADAAVAAVVDGPYYCMEMKTLQAENFKRLFNDLKEILNDTVLVFDPSGMKIVSFNAAQTVLVHLVIWAQNLEYYFCDRTHRVGVSMYQLHKLIKTMSSTDMLTLYLDNNDMNYLGMKFESKDRVHKTTQKLRTMDLAHPFEVPRMVFDKTITLSAPFFAKLCRDMDSIADFVEIKDVNDQLIFTCIGDFCTRETVLNDTHGRGAVTSSAEAADDSAREEDEEEEEEEEGDEEDEEEGDEEEGDEAEDAAEEEGDDSEDAAEEEEGDEKKQKDKEGARRSVAATRNDKKKKRTTTQQQRQQKQQGMGEDIVRHGGAEEINGGGGGEEEEAEEAATAAMASGPCAGGSNAPPDDDGGNIARRQQQPPPEIVHGVFSLEYLKKFTKFTDLSKTVDLLMKNDFPMLVRYPISSLGEIKLLLSEKDNDDDHADNAVAGADAAEPYPVFS